MIDQGEVIAAPILFFDKMVLISVEDFTEFPQYDESNSVNACTKLYKAHLITTSYNWVIGSYATNHTIGNHNNFSSFQSHKEPSTVTVAEGSNFNCVGSGTVKLNSSINLSSILSLPKLAFNLIYVSIVTRE